MRRFQNYLVIVIFSFLLFACGKNEVTQPTTSNRAGNWTGTYGSGFWGLSFVVDNNGSIRDFYLTTDADDCGDYTDIEVFLAGPTNVNQTDSLTFKTPSADGSEGGWAFITMRGKFCGDTVAEGNFDINFGKGFCGGISRGVHFKARKDCSLKPLHGFSATRFCL